MSFVVVVDREGPVGAFETAEAAAAALSPYHALSFVAYEFGGAKAGPAAEGAAEAAAEGAAEGAAEDATEAAAEDAAEDAAEGAAAEGAAEGAAAEGAAGGAAAEAAAEGAAAEGAAEARVWVIPADGQPNAIVYAGRDAEEAREIHGVLKAHEVVPPDDLEYFCREFGAVWAEQRLALAMAALETPAAQTERDDRAVEMFETMLTGGPPKKGGPDESLPRLASIRAAVVRAV